MNPRARRRLEFIVDCVFIGGVIIGASVSAILIAPLPAAEKADAIVALLVGTPLGIYPIARSIIKRT